MDASEIGRLGTLSLLRRTPPDGVVTSYPIDDEDLTIGRDQSCSLRLYYPAVSSLHAKITFVDRKAFLVVLGTNGVLLDDTSLFPAAATAPGPTTVPLQNNSVIEIHKKRFRFMYPPKHLRSAVINTPTQATPMAQRRPLRLSMIASAHVFTPRPSRDPQENLRILQTPLRTPFAREQEEIVLVHSNSPRVVEEDQDLVILDEVEPEPILPLPVPQLPQYPVTPVRRAPRPSLHRAVLLRSAQRAALQQREIMEEEAQDEEEVEETIGAIAEEVDDDIQEIPPPQTSTEPSSWRKSLDAVKGSLGWAFRGLSVEPKEEEDEYGLPEENEEFGAEEFEEPEEADDGLQEHDEYENEDARDDEGDDIAEPQRPLGQFMSPQIPKIARQPRPSLGVVPDAGPRRVRVVAPWKVNEIEVPPTVKEESNQSGTSETQVPTASPRSPVKREKLTEEEREAIRARRRSALATPDYFKGQTPGSRRTLFPSLTPLPSPSFIEPASTTSQTEQPTNDASLSATTSTSSASSAKVEEEEEDTAVLLARMKQMMEGVKQRQSLGRQSLSLSPRKREGGFSLLAPNHTSTHRPSRILIEEDDMDEDEDHPHAEITAPTLPNPQTPQMADLRHLFGRPRGETNTPTLAGVRSMFQSRIQGPTQTPQMEGVREMLETPEAYRAAPVTVTDAVDNEEGGEEVEDEPVAELPAPAPAQGKRTPAPRTARRTPVPQSAPPKSTRASSQVPEGSDDVAEGRTVRRTRAKTADGAVGQIPRPTRGRAAKTATPEPKEDEDEPAVQTVPAPTRIARRTRQATDTSTTSSHADETSAATTESKPTRKTRGKTPTLASGASTTTTTKTTVRRGTRAKPIEVTEDENENEEDPLDSLPRGRTPSGDAPAGRTRRGARGKAAVKQEDVEDGVPAEQPAAAPAPARATRARRTPVPQVPSGAAGTTTTSQSRGGTRTRGAAAVSTAVEASIPEDKENTPEPSTGTEEDGEEVKVAPGATKTRGGARGTRGAGKAAAAARHGKNTPEPIEESAPAPVVRTRVTRTRAGRA